MHPAPMLISFCPKGAKAYIHMFYGAIVHVWGVNVDCEEIEEGCTKREWDKRRRVSECSRTTWRSNRGLVAARKAIPGIPSSSEHGANSTVHLSFPSILSLFLRTVALTAFSNSSTHSLPYPCHSPPIWLMPISPLLP